MKQIADWQASNFTLGIATDHGGYELKTKLIEEVLNETRCG